MAAQKPTVALDHELSVWIDAVEDEPREVIVEARVPTRLVRFATDKSCGNRPEEVNTEAGPSRDTVLEELQAFLTDLVGESPRVLSASGAIPLLATKSQVRQIVLHPYVKAVRVNRRLK